MSICTERCSSISGRECNVIVYCTKSKDLRKRENDLLILRNKMASTRCPVSYPGQRPEVLRPWPWKYLAIQKKTKLIRRPGAHWRLKSKPLEPQCTLALHQCSICLRMHLLTQYLLTDAVFASGRTYRLSICFQTQHTVWLQP